MSQLDWMFSWSVTGAKGTLKKISAKGIGVSRQTEKSGAGC